MSYKHEIPVRLWVRLPKDTVKYLILILLFLSSPVYGQDIRDLRFVNNEYNRLLQAMEEDPKAFFHADVDFRARGITKSARFDTIYSVEVLETDPEYRLVALLQEQEFGFYFRFLKVRMNEFGIETEVEKDVHLRDIAFTARVSLRDRLLVLENEEFGITKLYPIGVGSLNEGYYQHDPNTIQSLSPTYDGGSIKREDLWMSRTYPKYYKGRPFIRVTSAKGNYTAFGFHIVQDTPTLYDLTRGFTSRGCIRMREHDLYEFAAIVRYGKLKEIPLDMTYEPSELDHPYPRTDKYYYRPKNFGTKKHPEFRRDEKHNLLILEKVRKPVPYDNLLPSEVEIVPEEE